MKTTNFSINNVAFSNIIYRKIELCSKNTTPQKFQTFSL